MRDHIRIKKMKVPGYRWHKEHGRKLFDLDAEDLDQMHLDGWRDSEKRAANVYREKPKGERSVLFAEARRLGLKPSGRTHDDTLKRMIEDAKNADLQPKPEDSAINRL